MWSLLRTTPTPNITTCSIGLPTADMPTLRKGRVLIAGSRLCAESSIDWATSDKRECTAIKTSLVGLAVLANKMWVKKKQQLNRSYAATAPCTRVNTCNIGLGCTQAASYVTQGKGGWNSSARWPFEMGMGLMPIWTSKWNINNFL